MTTKTLLRVTAAVVVTVAAYSALGVVGLWGVALAAPALVLAPSAVRSAAAERKSKKALDVELSRILGRGHDRG